MIYYTPIDRLREAMNPTVLNFLPDVTGSMDKLHEAEIVCGSINEILVPALKGAHPDRKGLLRVSMGAFSDGKIESLTKGGYLSVDQLMRNPIKNAQLYKPGLNRSTALYASMIKGINSCFSVAKMIRAKMRCEIVDGRVVLLTDGTNYTDDPTTPNDVRNAIRKANSYRDGVNLKVFLAYFKTETGPDRRKFESIAEECGIPKSDCYFWADHGTSLAAQKKAFRHLIEVLSTRF